MSLGERLILLRKAKQLSQEDVAEALNVTRQTVSKWETDGSKPDFDKIIPLCELFEISTEELLTGKTIEQNENNIVNNNEERKIKRTQGLIIGLLLYFVSVAWIMISIPVLQMNPVVGSAIFILICGVATCIIVYTSIVYKKEKTKEEKKEDKLYKQIDSIISIITVILYLGISFLTMAWHITWLIWLIYALVMKIVKLIISLKDGNYEK